ncbi:KH domain-containing protein [Terriglobus sp.]|uniref:KH domain-containing protein n=1 Tax=Terriglobus sp. TaxID=1889013 RepID=UPI003AFFFE9B
MPDFYQELAGLLRSNLVWLVDKPELLTVTASGTDTHLVLTISCNPDDAGRIVGRQARLERAIRTLFQAIGMKRHRSIEIVIPDYRGGNAVGEEVPFLLD